MIERAVACSGRPVTENCQGPPPKMTLYENYTEECKFVLPALDSTTAGSNSPLPKARQENTFSHAIQIIQGERIILKFCITTSIQVTLIARDSGAKK